MNVRFDLQANMHGMGCVWLNGKLMNLPVADIEYLKKAIEQYEATKNLTSAPGT